MRHDDDAASRPEGAGQAEGQASETYLWPLVALVLAILPQVLVPPSMREGPPLLVPLIEGIGALLLLAVAAKPGRTRGPPAPDPHRVRGADRSEHRCGGPTRGLGPPEHPKGESPPP